MPDAHLTSAVARATATAAAYVAAAWLAVWLSREPGNVAAFWPADGLLLGLLLRRGREEWAASLATCAAAKLAFDLLLGHGLAVSAAFAASNMLGVVTALTLLTRLRCVPLRLVSLRELAAFLLAAGVAPVLGALASATVVHDTLAAPFWTTWRTWWVGNAAGLALVTPAIAAHDGCREVRKLLAGPNRVVVAEVAAAVGLLAGGLWLVTTGRADGCLSLFAPVLLWTALRFGVGPTAAAGLAVALGATVAAVHGAWPPPYAVDATAAARIGPLQLYAVLTALSPLLAAVVTAERARAQAGLAESERRYAFALEAAQDAFWDWHVPSGRSRASVRWETMLGYAPGELPDGAEAWARTVHPDDLGPVLRAVDRHLAGETPSFEAEYRSRHKDGRWLWLVSRGRVMERDPAGRPLRMLGTTTDITERKRVEIELAEAKARLDDALASMQDGLALFDAEERLVLCNQRYGELFPRSADLRKPGVTAGELIGAAAFRGEYAGVDPGRAAAWAAARVASLRAGEAGDLELADGRWVHVVTRRTATGGLIAVYRDVTERKRLEVELERRATRDPLTGLANRALFAAELGRAWARVERDGGRLAVMLVDLDRFKEVNDTHGHAAGDRLLVEVAGRLAAAVREGDLVARLGGDEFAILASGGFQDQDFAILAERIVARLREPLHLGGLGLTAGASLGLAVHPDAPGGPEELLAAADRALYVAKAAGRGGWAADPGEGGPVHPAPLILVAGVQRRA